MYVFTADGALLNPAAISEREAHALAYGYLESHRSVTSCRIRENLRAPIALEVRRDWNDNARIVTDDYRDGV